MSAMAMSPTQLRCEYRENPLGVDLLQPRLSWILESDKRGEIQTAYQVLAASSLDILDKNQSDLWNSGKIKSDQSAHVSYAGKALVSSQQVFWKVRVWDARGEQSAWSDSAQWTMGLLNDSDWHHAKWIGALGTAKNADLRGPRSKYESALLRKEFEIKGKLGRAVVHVCGLGQYEMMLNGKNVSNDLMSPGWTLYSKTCLYDTYDITAALRPGKNAIGLFLGNGMYHSHLGQGRYTYGHGWSFGPLQAIICIHLQYTDGSVETLISDRNWKIISGPITYSSPYGGEDYDVRLEPQDWSIIGFDDSQWETVAELSGPGGVLKGLQAAAPPLRTYEIFHPVATKELPSGAKIYDLGQNASIIPRVLIKGALGSSVKITPSELIDKNGDIDDAVCKGGSWWRCILKGNGKEMWFPKFYYRGARYFKVETEPAPDDKVFPALDKIEGVVVHSSLSPAGEFSCSNELFNKIHTLVRWAQRSNMMSIMTDCPTREKLGWLEEDHLNGPALRYEFDLAPLFTKIMNDIADSQLASGFVPNIAPEYCKFGGNSDSNPFRNSPEWGSTFILGGWQQVEFNGDLELIQRHYTEMQHYLDYLDRRASEHILDFGLGDWYDIGPGHPGKSQLTPKALTATAIYYEDVVSMGKMARLLRKNNDAVKYEAQASTIRIAFNKKFFNLQDKQYSDGSQCANAMPLAVGLVEEEDRSAVLDNLIRDIHAKGLTAGDVGYRYLLRALADAGRSDIIFDLNNQSEKPGYGMQLVKGATSLTEAWDAGESSSQNHFMLGQINEWFYHDLAGIQPDSNAPGFKKVIIKPALVGDILWVKSSYQSLHGRIVNEWKRQGNKLVMDITIPANTTATVFVPSKKENSITESGNPAKRSEGVKQLRTEVNATVFEIGSGTYQFSALVGE